MTEVEKARLSILSGNVYDGIGQLYRLRRSGYDVDFTLIEDILNLPTLLQYLYDETAMGDAASSMRCLAALKSLGMNIDPRQINYIRYKKMSMMGVGMNGYFTKARPAVRKLLETLQSFFAHIGDFRECVVHKTETRITIEEDVIVRFPNHSFRDLFLQNAFQQAIDSGLSFHWENHHSFLNEELTGRISWSLIQQNIPLQPEWYREAKDVFDRFILSLADRLERLALPRYHSAPSQRGELLWIVFSRDGSVSRRLSANLRNYNTIQIQDIKLLDRHLVEDLENFGAFIFHVGFNDFDVLESIVEHKLQHPTSGAPFIVFADHQFFRVMKDHSLLFPGCEYVTEMNPENVQNLEFIVSKVMQNRRRFIRLPVGMECTAVFGDEVEHTRATPISVGGTFIRTHRIIPVFSNTDITLLDREADFEETLRGKVVYNAQGGSAVRFDNIIPYEKFRKLRELSLQRHARIVDTLKRSSL